MPTSVLVIDDDPSFRALAVRLLTSMGLAVVGEACTVQAGRDAAIELRPQAALVDINLPDGDGLELAGSLAALPWAPRVLLTSSDADATTVAAARSAGAVGFVAKDELPGSVLGLLAP